MKPADLEKLEEGDTILVAFKVKKTFPHRFIVSAVGNFMTMKNGELEEREAEFAVHCRRIADFKLVPRPGKFREGDLVSRNGFPYIVNSDEDVYGFVELCGYTKISHEELRLVLPAEKVDELIDGKYDA